MGLSGTTSQLHYLLFLLFTSPYFQYCLDHLTMHKHWSPQYNSFSLFPFAFTLPLHKWFLFSLSIYFFILLSFSFPSFSTYSFLLPPFPNWVPGSWCPILLLVTQALPPAAHHLWHTPPPTTFCCSTCCVFSSCSLLAEVGITIPT